MNFPAPSSTPSPQLTPRVDFDLDRWVNLIAQKGVDCKVEKAFQCPCKTDEMNAISNCQNCGGSGWLFINPRTARFVLQGMGVTRDYESWSETNKGVVNFSCMPSEQLTFMDRITRLNAISIYNQVVSFKQVNTTTFAFTTYAIEEIDAILLYQTPTSKLKVLSKETDFWYQDNLIYLNQSFEIPENGELTATIRYFHHPAFHVMDMTREAVDNFILKNNKEMVQQLPVRGVARRAHQIENMENLAGNRIIDNSFEECDCETKDKIFTQEFSGQFS